MILHEIVKHENEICTDKKDIIEEHVIDTIHAIHARSKQPDSASIL